MPESNTQIARVVVASPSRELDKVFHYAIPQGETVLVGTRVMVPFGRGDKTMQGIVVGFDQQQAAPLKEIKQVLDPTPLCTPQLVALAEWMRQRYLCTYYQALKLVIPTGVGVKTTRWITLMDLHLDVAKTAGRSNVKAQVLTRLIDNGGTMDWGSLADIPNASTAIKGLERAGVVSMDETVAHNVPNKRIRTVALAGAAPQSLEDMYRRAPKQAKMLELLQQTGEIAVTDLLSFSGGSYQGINTLQTKGLVQFFDRVVLREVYDVDAYEKSQSLSPTEEQQEILSRLKTQADTGDLTPVLLRGVTGSGKTEVFLQIISHLLDQQKQAIVLVPEISLTPQMVARFVGRFGGQVSVLHSGLSLGERYDEWMKIRTGKVRVAVGARSAVFAPFSNLGIVIVDEEHESAYKSEQAPYYCAKEVALERGKQEQAMVLFGSATPSLGSYYKATTGQYRLFEMHSRHNAAPMPAVTVVDMRKELEAGNRSPFSRELYHRLGQNIANKQQSILFLNRRGFNSFVLCRDCGQAVTCRNCSISLTYHKRSGQLKCHYCGYEQPPVSLCPQCGSSRIRFMGTGTEKIEETLIAQFGRDSFLRMDADTTSGKNSHEAILKRFERDNVPILLGTQMVTKGLDFPNVTLVGVLAADLSLGMDDFRAAERTFSQLTQVCGRAGRGNVAGHAIVQTYQPEHYAIQFAKAHDYAAFYQSEIAIRQQLNNPPFCDLILLLLQGEREALLQQQLTHTAAALREQGLSVLGPTPAPYGKIKNKYRWRLIVKHPDSTQLLPLLQDLLEAYSKGDTQLSIDINPNGMN